LEKGLRIQLLGNFHLVYDGKPVTGLDSPRLQALITYLLLHRESPIQRQHLSYTFWPDSTDSQARTNLRNLIFRLREAFPEVDQFLDVETKTIWWQSNSPINMDLDQFEDAVKLAEEANQAGEAIKYQQGLEDGVAAYGGDLLPSCYDDWIIPERERLSQEYIRVLEELADLLEADQDYPGAIKIAQKLLRQDPLHEASSRLLMELHALNGDTARALRAYHTCAAALEKELGLEPSPATLELYEGLMDRDHDREIEKPPRITEKAITLVGRDEVMKLLQKTWRELTDQPHLALIQGEAGTGKTYLAEEISRWISRQGIRNLKTRCYPTKGELAYTPLTDLLRDDSIKGNLTALDDPWLVELNRLLPELKSEFPDLPKPEELSESWQRGRMFEACTRAILGKLGKLVILVDDLQWCDRETLAWLHFLMEYKSNTSLMVIGTIRSEDLVPDSPLTSLINDLKQKGLTSTIELDNLDQETTAVLAANLWGDQLDDQVVKRLYQETEGNPLFVVEVVRSGYLMEKPGVKDQISIPPKVQAVIENRLAFLSPSTREITNLAAAVGREFNFDLLSRAEDIEEEGLLQGLDELWQRRVIRDQGAEGYDFSHEKFREVIYQGLSPHRRKQAHQKIAKALKEIYQEGKPEIASQLAGHLDRAGENDQAADFYIEAGDQARRIYARDDAIDYYQRASDLLDDQKGSRSIDLFQGWGKALLKLARYQEAGDIYQKMGSSARSAGEVKAEAQAWLALGKVQDRQGNFQDALVCADKALDLAQDNKYKEETANGYLLKGQQHYRLGEVDQAEEFIKKALDLNKKTDQQLAVGRCLNLLGLIEDVRGNFSQAREYKNDAIKLFEDIEHRQSQWWIGNITLNLAISADLQGDYQDAVGLYQNAMEIMEEISDQDWKRTCLINLSASKVGLGEHQQAEEYLQQVLELTGTSEWLGLSLTYYFLAESYLGQNQDKKALTAAQKALALAQESGAQEHLGAAWRVMGKVASETGKSVKIDEKDYQPEGCFQKSIELFHELGGDAERAHSIKAWAAHEIKAGDKVKGKKMWEEAKGIFQRLEMAAEVKRMDGQ